MRTDKRLWRTEKGDLVEDGHPEAVSLAYGENDEISDNETVRGTKPPAKATPKKAAQPTPKKRA